MIRFHASSAVGDGLQSAGPVPPGPLAHSLASPRTAFFYGAPVPVEALSRFDRIVIEADNVHDLRGLCSAGAAVFAYVSVGEAEGWRPSARDLPEHYFLGTHAAWGSRIADLTHPGWRRYLLEVRMAGLWDTGYRGFFLDTLDSFRRVVSAPSGQRMQSLALVSLIREIHRRFPGVQLLLNRGFDIVPEVAPLVSGVAAESLFQGWNPERQAYVEVAPDDRQWLLARLTEVTRQHGLPVAVIDYVPADRPALARETERRIEALGFSPWVASPSLDTLPF